MFGYINVNQPELKVRELTLYKSYYCGLCDVLKNKYGRVGQMTLNYDTTFLAILLSALYESTEEQTTARCLLHPTAKRMLTKTEYTAYAADMTMILSYFQLQDHWRDEKSVKALAGSRLLARQYRSLAAQYPRQCSAVQEAIDRMHVLEQAQSDNLDEVAGCTGAFLQEMFVAREDVWAAQLRRMGMHIGKFVYLMDAYEDLEADLKKNRYNPLKTLAGRDDYEALCEEILRLWMAEAAAAFETLPILVNAELIRNILYAGVWTKYDMMRSRKQKKETGQSKKQTTAGTGADRAVGAQTDAESENGGEHGSL